MIGKNRVRLLSLSVLVICNALSLASNAAPLAPALQSAKQYISAGNTQKALSQLDHFLKTEPDSALGHYYRGKALAKLAKNEKAKEEFETAALLDPTPAFATDCQKQIADLSKSPKGAGKAGNDKVFHLRGEQNRTLTHVTPGLRQQLRSQVADLYQLASANAPSQGYEEEAYTPAPPIPGSASRSPQPPVPPPKLHAVLEELVIPPVKLTASEKQNLSKHDVYFIVDHSGSMGCGDCPGRLSRWQWVQAQMNQMEAETKQCTPRGVTMVFFDTNAEEFKKVSSAEMLRLFSSFKPRGCTNTGLALRSQIRNITNSLSSNHPAVVIAITDGRPNNRLDLTQAIEELDNAASRQKQRLKIAFLQVGSDYTGLQTLKDLNEMLAAHKTLVKVHAFDEVCKKGLTRTILDEL